MPYLLVLLLIWTQLLHAEDLTEGFDIKILGSAKEISLHDTVQLDAELKHPEEYTVDLKQLRTNLLRQNGMEGAPFVLIDEEVISRPESTKVTYTLEPRRTGNFLLTFWEIQFLPRAEGSIVQLISDLIPVQVALPHPTPKEDRMAPPIKLTRNPPIEINHENREELMELAGLEERNINLVNSRSIPWTKILGALFFIFLLFWSRQLKRAEPPPPAKKLPEVRDRILQKLDHLSHLKDKDSNELYIQITDAVRIFFEEGYQIHASTETTEEFLRSPEYQKWEPERKERISSFLQTADRVKFAQQKISDTEQKAAFQYAKEFIRDSSIKN